MVWDEYSKAGHTLLQGAPPFDSAQDMLRQAQGKLCTHILLVLSQASLAHHYAGQGQRE